MEQPMVHHHQWVPLPRSAVAPVLWHGPSKVWKGTQKKKVDVNSSGNQGAFSCFFLGCVCVHLLENNYIYIYIYVYIYICHGQNIVYRVPVRSSIPCRGNPYISGQETHVAVALPHGSSLRSVGERRCPPCRRPYKHTAIYSVLWLSHVFGLVD